jgi:acyl-homoserine-lactone acylase
VTRFWLLTLLVSAPLLSATKTSATKTEILWDSYGVPHIYAPNREAMFYAHGWAQMRNQADLLLLLYGESRGRAAEYWGASFLDLDRWLAVNSMPERAVEWYKAQTPEFRGYLDAFARGINDYAKAHPDKISPERRCVLPVSGIDVAGHALRVVHYMYMGSSEELELEVKAYRNKDARAENLSSPGSNTWSIDPSRTASHHAMLIINPHLAWGKTFYRYMEVHMSAPGYDLYGAPQIGFPVAVVGFNRRAGWGRTVNTIDTVDFYRLTVDGGQYLFDGKLRAFDRETKRLKIKQADGTFKTESVEIRRSVHGPVVYDSGGLTIAMRVAGLDRPKMLEQWFRMGEAQNLAQFTNALRMMSVPMWNANYADADGHIMLTFDGLVPRRRSGDFEQWSQIVPGDTSKTLWTAYHPFEDLPRSLDPPSGFNQNTNEPPWTMTLPELDPAKYPSYFAPPLSTPPSARTLRSLQMLSEEKSFTFEKLLADKHSTRIELADALVPDLLRIAGASRDPKIAAAARLLAAWDHNAESSSRGAVLFQLFADEYLGFAAPIDPKLRIRWNPAQPLHSAYGIADPALALKSLSAAVTKCIDLYGAIDVAWGDVYRFSSGNADLPGNGASSRMGSFRTVRYDRKEGKRYYAAHGETFVCAIEFSQPQQAECLLGYGNASQTGSPHLEDQLPLMVEKKLHPVWRDKADVERHLELRESF